MRYLPHALTLAAVSTILVTAPTTGSMGPVRIWIWLVASALAVGLCTFLHGRLAESQPFDPGPWRVPTANLEREESATPRRTDWPVYVLCIAVGALYLFALLFAN